MPAFRDYRQAIRARRPCCPASQCAPWRSHPARLRHQFTAMVRRSWSPAEITTLRTAVRRDPAACDGCGPATLAAYRVDRAGELYLCGPCASRHWRALSAQGWTFWPLGVRALAPQADTVPGHHPARE